jgi:hypothetical protein
MNWPKKKKKKKIQKKRDKRFPVEGPIDWIHWFCKLKGNEYFVEVDEDFIKKEENLYYIYS